MTLTEKMGNELNGLLTRAEAYMRLSNLEIANLDELHTIGADPKICADKCRKVLERDMNLFADLVEGIKRATQISDKMSMEAE